MKIGICRKSLFVFIFAISNFFVCRISAKNKVNIRAENIDHQNFEQSEEDDLRPTLKIPIEWRKCKADSECTSMVPACEGCSMDAISKTSYPNFSKQMDKHCYGYKGVQMDCEFPPTTPRCQLGSCVLREDNQKTVLQNAFFEKIKQMIRAGKFESAAKMLNDFKPKGYDEEGGKSLHLARIFSRQGQYGKAMDINKVAMSTLSTGSAAHFNQACFACLSRNAKACLSSLKDFRMVIPSLEANEINFFYKSAIKDKDLDFARNHPEIKIELDSIIKILSQSK